jgi:hypothetical protein
VRNWLNLALRLALGVRAVEAAPFPCDGGLPCGLARFRQRCLLGFLLATHVGAGQPPAGPRPSQKGTGTGILGRSQSPFCSLKIHALLCTPQSARDFAQVNLGFWSALPPTAPRSAESRDPDAIDGAL